MEFTCNAQKNAVNIAERGLPLLASAVMFDNHMVVREDVRTAYPERRYIGYNTIDGRLMVVVFCRPSENHIHIISFRKANHREQKKFNPKSL